MFTFLSPGADVISLFRFSGRPNVPNGISGALTSEGSSRDRRSSMSRSPSQSSTNGTPTRPQSASINGAISLPPLHIPPHRRSAPKASRSSSSSSSSNTPSSSHSASGSNTPSTTGTSLITQSKQIIFIIQNTPFLYTLSTQSFATHPDKDLMITIAKHFLFQQLYFMCK